MNLIVKYIYSTRDEKYLSNLKLYLFNKGKTFEIGIEPPTSSLDMTIYLENKEDFYLIDSLINWKNIKKIYLVLINLEDVPF